jgi:ribulose 1,5-bisphosphate synthetase/thiazole synthase
MRDPLTTINIKLNKALLNEPYDVIIFGFGISGLCCAALLALKGKKSWSFQNISK